MIKDTKKLANELVEKSKLQIKKFISELNELSEGKEFTIDNIELLMTKYNKESKQSLVDSVDVLISKYDETKIIEEKKD